MKRLTFYRILSFILVPIALFFGLMDVLFLLSATGNPSYLLPVFLIACLCIYVFTSLSFLNKHINKNATALPSLKDWIRVNAYVSLFFGFMLLIEALGIFYMADNQLRSVIEKFLETQPNMPSGLTVTVFIKLMRGIAYFLFFFSIILLMHISISLKLLKEYAHLFSDDHRE